LLKPAELWCLTDEDEGTINDAMFMVCMADQNCVWDRPTTRHGLNYEISFADGHSAAIRLTAPVDEWFGTSVVDPDWVKLKGMSTIHK
jgi:hypothetical protein